MTNPITTRDDLARMSTDEINTARREGRLNDLLRGPAPEDAPGEDIDDTEPEPEPELRVPARNPAHGANGSREPQHPITSAEQLRSMSPHEINELRRTGQLDRLMGRPARTR